MKSPTLEQASSVVVVSTHLDDAVFSCYGSLGPETTVVTVLAGVPPPGVLGGWDADGGATDSHDRVLERRDEDRRGCSSHEAHTSTWTSLTVNSGDRQASCARQPTS